jgi:outer membrane protein OmpA-like peptidoglycan-associated protein
MGAQGPIGAVQTWSSYRNFLFDVNQSDIRSSEISQVSEIATYMQQNPSLQLGIDGSADSRGDVSNLSQRRVNAVRAALIQAGVPAGKIQAGAFGDQRLNRDGRVEVLVRSSN